MQSQTGVARAALAPETACRLVVRKEKGPSEILQFLIAGLEVGQQVVAIAAPSCLKDLACSLGESGLRPETLLRNGRLIFLTAPDCLSLLTKPKDSLRCGPLRLNGSLVR